MDERLHAWTAFGCSVGLAAIPVALLVAASTPLEGRLDKHQHGAMLLVEICLAAALLSLRLTRSDMSTPENQWIVKPLAGGPA